jgi:cytohesin
MLSSLLVIAGSLLWGGSLFADPGSNQPSTQPAAKGNEIFEAARNGDFEKVKSLLKDNADLVFSRDDSGDTPLHWAVSKGHKEVAELLLANKADVNAKNNVGETPLFSAASKEMAKLLLGNKADVNARDNGDETPLHEANKEVTEVLLANGADVNARTNNGTTPLHLAAFDGNKDRVSCLLASNADVNARTDDGDTPLHWAAKGAGSSDVAKLLLDHKADVNAKDKGGHTPLDNAETNSHQNIADLLRQHGGVE